MFSSRFMLFPALKKKFGVKKNSGGGAGGVEIYIFFWRIILSYFTFYAIVNIKKNTIEKYPFTWWLNGRWFLQIVDRDSGNLYIQYNPLFPCSDFWSQTYQMWGWFGGGGG